MRYLQGEARYVQINSTTQTLLDYFFSKSCLIDNKRELRIAVQQEKLQINSEQIDED